MRFIAPAALAFSFLAHPAGAEDAGTKAPRVELDTTSGKIVLELDAVKAPESTSNFLRYVRDGHYDGVIFHRVIPGFMAQGGGFDTEFNQLETRDPVTNESKNGLSNARGTIAMARTSAPHSATAQFFINLVDNDRLDGNANRWGYAVFGRVVEGMEAVDAIAGIPTGPGGPFRTDVPQAPVVIKSARVVE
jgi:cyclophilin family peptidyl-prolyl cis-trans isomerase